MSNKSYATCFASDIFHRKTHPSVVEKAHKRNVFKIKTDVFHESKIETDNKLRSRSNKSQSDIFFKIPIKTKPDQSDRRNVSNRSIVFSHLNSKDYVVIRQRHDKPFEPSPKLNREITPVKRRLNELYTQEELNYSDINKSTCSLTSKGYLLKEEASYNPIKKIRPCVNRRKCIWELEQNHLNQDDQMNKTTTTISSKRDKMKEMRSNIFNDQTLETINQANMTMIKSEKVKSDTKEISNTQPKKYHQSKWISKLDWKSPTTELLFKNANDKEEEKRSAYQRKHSQLYGSVPSLSHCHNQCFKNEEFVEKESIDPYISQKYKRQDKRRRINDNVSSCFTHSHSFYEKTMQYSTNNPIEHEYQIKEGNNIEPKDIQKLFEQKGIQVYNILDDSSAIFGKTSYRFKIRENDKDGFSKTFSEMCEKMKKEKGVDILPIQKITVNKKKPYEIQLPNDKLFPNAEVKKSNNNKSKTIKRVQKGTKYKKKFTSEFNTIDNRYKNNGVRDSMNRIK